MKANYPKHGLILGLLTLSTQPALAGGGICTGRVKLLYSNAANTKATGTPRAEVILDSAANSADCKCPCVTNWNVPVLYVEGADSHFDTTYSLLLSAAQHGNSVSAYVTWPDAPLADGSSCFRTPSASAGNTGCHIGWAYLRAP